MPNAAQYREAAARYRHLGEHYLRHAALVTGWPLATHLGAGVVADAVSGVLRDAGHHLAAASSEMAALALVCERRATICDEYQRRVQLHRALDPMTRLRTPPPVPPFGWVSGSG